ncbi:MAG: hypothetical protein E7367_00625 [Clostridiales bacterium]|nr:hypothetical protein [Clostridiales bacterium]
MKRKIKLPLKILGWFVSVVLALLILIFVGEKLVFASFFFGGAKSEMKTPGTWTNYVQQGFDRLEEGKFLVSTYDKGDDKAAIFIIDGKKSSCVELKNADGTPYLSHAGGVTHYKNWVYVATDNHVDTEGEVYCTHDNCDTNLDMFLLSDVVDGDGKATMVDSITVPNRLAYASVYGDMLYVGAFHREGSKYITPESHHITTPAGDKNTALMMVYEMDENTGKPVHATPEYCYSTLSNVQGMCMSADGDIILSTSWGLSTSHLYQYDVKNATAGTVTVSGASVPVYHLDSACLIEDVKAPPMAEELVWLDGRVYILTESASMKYLFGKLMSGNRIYSYPLA